MSFLISKKEYEYHVEYKILGLKIKLKKNGKLSPDERAFLERNIKENAKMRLYGWWDNCKDNINEFFQDEIFAWYLLKEKVRYYLLKQFTIPQIEFVLTTNCTLNCKHCSNYIPSIKDKYMMSLDEFKDNVDVLSKGSKEILTTLLLGGEPLLNKNLPQMINYIAKNRKFRTIYIVTNATINFSDELINAIKKYRKKVRVYISNYSANEELKNILKTNSIIKTLKKNNIAYYTQKDLKWLAMTPCAKLNMLRGEVVSKFINCGAKCTQIYNRQMHICPISTLCKIKQWFEFDTEQYEYVYLDPKKPAKKMKKSLIEFYKRDYFQACDCCTKILGTKQVIPAEQITDKEELLRIQNEDIKEIKKEKNNG